MAHNVATSPMLLTWRDALQTFKRTLSDKDLKAIQLPTDPEDLITYVKESNLYQQGKSANAISTVQSGVARIQRFNACMDTLSQGLPDPATLLWGSIKFVLKIVQDFAEEYDKICEAFSSMVAALPRVELYADAFPGSTLVQESVHDVFISSLYFWMKACKFYRRRKLFNFVRATWSDYNIEFSHLESAMKSAVDRVERGGIAEHIKAANAFRSEQQLLAEKTFKLQQSEVREKLTTALSSSTGDAEYYVRDHKSAQRLRHPGTCAWILENDTFARWYEEPVTATGPNLFLWINGGPGMGKTVLAAAIIDYMKSPSAVLQHPNLVYFYFKEFSSGRNNPSAAIVSFFYQVLAQNKDNPVLESKISGIFQGSSKPEFDTLWDHLCAILEQISPVTFILDGLDECSDSKTFVKKLRDLTTNGKAKVLITSRREKQFLKALDLYESLELTPDLVQKDIQAFVQYKLAKNPLLSNPIISDLVEQQLLHSNDGMFLWVCIVLKELKACLSVEQVRQALIQLPRGLEATYSAVVRRLETTLTITVSEVARMVLAWVISSARPMSFDELRTALSYTFKVAGHTLLYEESEFPYAEKDIEVICGSLIVIRNGQVQPAHYTVKSYISDLSKDKYVDTGPDSLILPKKSESSLLLAEACVSYFAEKSPLLSVERDILTQPQIGNELFGGDTFLEYCCIYWSHHVLDCAVVHGIKLARLLTSRFDPLEVTCCWLERSLRLDRRGLWRLVIGVEELEAFFWEAAEMHGVREDDKHNPDMSYWYDSSSLAEIGRWCSGIRTCLNDYGTSFTECPSFIQILDFLSFAPERRFNSASNPESGGQREVRGVRHSSGAPIAKDADFERSHLLGYEDLGHFNLWKATLGFFVYDFNQGIFLSGEKATGLQERLHVQQAKSGRRLPPIIKGLGENVPKECRHGGMVITTALSSDGKYFVIAYHRWFSVWVIEHDIVFQQNRKTAQRLTSQGWASRLMVCPYYNSANLDKANEEAAIITISPENHLLVPGGLFKLPSRTFYPFALFEQSNSQNLPTLFSGNGSSIFRVQKDKDYQQIFQNQTNNSLSNSTVRVFEVNPEWAIKPSDTGAYLVLFDPDINAESAHISLIDCHSSKRFDISTGKVAFGHRSFHFSEGDKQLVTFLRGPKIRYSLLAQVTVTVWKLGSAEGPKKCSEGAIRIAIRSCSSWGLNPPFFAMKSDEFAWIVTCDRSIHSVQFDLSTISFPNSGVSNRWNLYEGGLDGFDTRSRTATGYEPRHTEISHHGRFFADVNIRDTEVRFHVCTIGNAILESEARWALRRYKLSTPLNRHVPSCLSNLFNTLVVGSHVFIDDTFARDSSPLIKLDIDLKEINSDSYGIKPNWECRSSSCGNIIAYFRPGRKDLGQLAIFRIDRSERTSSRLEVSSATDEVHKRLNIQVRSFSFHPSLPIATITYNLIEGDKRLDHENLPIMDLVTSIIHFTEPLTLPSPPFQRLTEQNIGIDEIESTELQKQREMSMGVISLSSFEPKMLVEGSVRFSDCGSFTYLPAVDSGDSITGRLLLSDIACSPQSLRVLGNRTIIHSCKSRSYILRHDKGLVWVEMHEYEALLDEVELPAYQKLRRTATAKYITAYPEKWDSYHDLKAWLILGESYDQRMSFWICPIEGSEAVLKTLTVSWNDVLNRLGRELSCQR